MHHKNGRKAKIVKVKIPPREFFTEAARKNNLRGRKQVYALELPIYDSLDQCSARTGIPVTALKMAKRRGCMLSRHSRVYLSEFIKWWFARDAPEDGEEMIDWAKRDKRASALMRELNLEESRHRVIDFELVERFVRHLVAVLFFGELDRLNHEFPASLKGKTELEIQAECEVQVARIRKALEQQIKVWAEKKGQV